VKSINQNTRPKNQPKDTYRYGKNGISNSILGTVENEPGFLKLPAVLPYKYNGCIETDKWPVIFTTDNVNSAVGYINLETGLYEPILDDVSLSFKIGFDSDFYITGVAQRNHIGEVVIAFTNKHNICGYLNCDNPDVETINDLSLFPVVSAPTIKVAQDSGGILSPGAYFVAVRYSKKDGTITGFPSISNLTIVSGASGTGITDKTLNITLSGLDRSYDFLEVAIIAKTSGVYGTPQLMAPIAITADEMQVSYTGTEITTDTTLENILIPQTYYERVGTMGQLNDYLYIGDLSSTSSINMQKWANLVGVKWKSELMSVTSPDPAHVRGEKRSWMHEEVVGLYIQYSLAKGGWSKWFHIPGADPMAGDLVASVAGAAQGLTALKYQMEDTVASFDSFTKTGTMGTWQNQNERYPDTPDFDSSSIGGRNLRNQPVLHHRFPSISWCKQNLYATTTNYGKDSLDLLGIEVSNVLIPIEYADQITGWRIGYAKRSLNNATVLGQSTLLHGARYAAYNNQIFTINTADNNYITTGGNFHSGRKRPNQPSDKALGIDTKLIRTHSFDILFNKPSIKPDYISTHLKLRRNNLRNEGFIENFDSGDAPNGPIVYLIDYLASGISPVLAGSAKRYRKISTESTETTYTPNNLITGKWNNIDAETCFAAKINAAVMDNADIPYQLVQITEDDQFKDWCPDWEVTYLTNLMQLREDVYAPFTRQTIVLASEKFTGTSGVMFGGDTFIVDYSFHTYGWWMQGNEKFGDLSGTKVARRYLCESAANLYGRYETSGNIYSKWYPKSALVKEDLLNYINQYSIKIDPNQFGYSKDLNTLNELLQDTGIFNTIDEDINEHPFRIHRGGKQGRQDKTRNWKTFLALDYYEIKKNVGRIVNIDGQDDRLLIHCQNALLVTQDKTKLETDVLKITLGAADIFQFEPQDGVSSPLGYVGTEHDLSCLRTPAGYFSVDAKSQEVFLHKQQPENIGSGLYNTFLEIISNVPKNVFTGDGITVGYDSVYKRFIFTQKRAIATKTVLYNPTSAEIAALTVGDYVYMHGQVLEYLGPNIPATSGVNCPAGVIPVVNDRTYTIAPGQYVNLLIDVINGVNVASVNIQSISPATSIFSLNPVTREFRLNGTVTASTSYVFTCRAVSSTGDEDLFTIVLNITP
jgi:hypothetical protein